MTPERQRQLLQGRSTIEQKIFWATPITGPQNANWILQALKRTSGSLVEGKTVYGCLERLKAAGLVREPKPKFFQRDAIAPLRTDNKSPTQVEAAESAPAELDAKSSLGDPGAALAVGGDLHGDFRHAGLEAVEDRSLPMRMGRLSAHIRDRASDLLAIADSMDGMALEIEARREVDEAAVDKFAQLKALLKEFA